MSTSRRRQQSLASHSGYEASVGDDVGCRHSRREFARVESTEGGRYSSGGRTGDDETTIRDDTTRV